jgi:hypothetical protein
MKLKPSTLLLPVLLLLLAVAPGAAAPLHSAPLRDFVAGPCAAAGVYDPACDANQDGQIDILDIQLTAGLWNRAGTFVSDNGHNHLGQTWIGNNNPLRLQGSFGLTDNAPLVLSNSLSSGHGLIISTVGSTGVAIAGAGNDGVSVGFPGSDGYSVLSAGAHGLNVQAAGGSGVNIGTVVDNGVSIDWAQGDGIFICRAGAGGACVPNATSHGIEVGNSQGDGLRITDADGDGIQIGDGTNFPATGLRIPSPGTAGDALLPNTSDANGQWALFTTDDIQAGNVFLSAQTLIAVVGGDQPIAPGALVEAVGLAEAIPGANDRLAQVRLAGAGASNVAGVAGSRMALIPLPDGDGDQVLRAALGAAQPGDYVAITVLGVAQVQVQAGEAIQPGQRLAVGDAPGRARALRTVQVEGVRVDESRPSVGVALEAPKDGLVWVLVNPQ